MNMEAIRHFLAWCAVINYAILIIWCLLSLWMPAWVTMITKMFGLADADFKSANYSGIMYYKLGIMLFNLAPYLALRIMA